MFLGLRIKLLFFSGALLLLSCLSLSLSNFIASKNALQQTIKENIATTAADLASTTGMVFETAEADIEALAGRIIVKTILRSKIYSQTDLKDLQNALSKLLEIKPLYVSMGFINAQRNIIASSDLSEISHPFPRADKLTSETSSSAESDFKNINPDDGTVLLTRPIKEQSGELLGYAYLRVSLDRIHQRFFEPVKVASSRYAFLLSPQGQIIVPTGKNTIREQGKSILQVILSTNSTRGFFLSTVQKESVQYAFQQNPATHLYTVMCVPTKEAYADLQQLKHIAWISTLVAVLCSAAVLFFILTPIVSALQRSVDFAKAIAAGELKLQLDVHRKDELGILAHSLRSIPVILNKLIDSYHSLEHEIEIGKLDACGEIQGFSGEYVALMQGANAIIERFTTILDSFPSPVVMLNAKKTAIYMNRAARDIAGGNLIGKTCGEIFHREDYNTSNCALQRAIDTRIPAHAETRIHVHGDVRDITYSSIPLFDTGGGMSCIVQFITDITEIKNTEKNILEVAQEATGISDRMANASEALRVNIHEVSLGAKNQHEQASSTAVAMEEMNSTVLEVAKNAAEASEQASATHKKASDGMTIVNSVITAINHVHTTAVALQENMHELGKQTQNIGGVISVISDIADQTNLLALNAAIEAARAGDAGRGFAVVADEVRKLAEQTMRATGDVGNNIQGIQQSALQNIQRVEEAAQRIDQATKLAAESGNSLSEILHLVNTNSTFIASIATAAEEQSATSEEINKSVAAINHIAEKTADGMSQSTAAVQEVAEMARELRELLDKFK